jgi:hypothetical protein
VALLNLPLQDYEVNPSELSLTIWEAPAFLESNGIDPEDLHGEWDALDRYIRNECTPDLNAEKIADLIHGGGWDTDDLERFIHVAVRALKLRVATEAQRARAA